MSKTVFSKVSGVTKKNKDGIARQKIIEHYCRPGMSLKLIREPKNRYDKNAVGVWVTVRSWLVLTNTLQLGYLGEEIAETVAPLMDKGLPVSAKIANLTGGKGDQETRGVNIELTLPDDTN